MPPGNRFTLKLKHSGDRNAASSRGAFRFACVQNRGCRGTSLGGALSVLLMQERGGTVGFGAGGGQGCVFVGGFKFTIKVKSLAFLIILKQFSKLQ